jgi:glycosyltransferase involved in cell wall biosynthesis
MKILLIPSHDYIHHPVPSRHHNIFEYLSIFHEVHVAHFHVSKDYCRTTQLVLDEVTLFSFSSPLLHYTLNAPYHLYVIDKIITENKIDIIVMSNVLANTAAIIAAKKNKIPVIFDLVDWLPDSAAAYFKNTWLQTIVRKTVWQITRMNLKYSNKIITVSPTLVKNLKALGFSAELITNGVDTEMFKPLDKEEMRKKLGINSKEYIIGFAGSLERWYNLSDMIKAMPELITHNPDVRLLIVGGSLFTDYEDELKKLSSYLKVSDYVMFVGLKPYAELPKYIACMDICVIPLLPTQWRDIALPNKYFEYTACGKPIIMTPIQDIESIGEGNLFVYRNKNEYIALIKALMGHSFKFSLNMEKHSWKEKARQFESIARGLVNT